MLAENLSGWAYNSLLLLGTIMTTLLALISLYAAGCGKRKTTILLLTPALLFVLFLGWHFGSHHGGLDSQEAKILILPPIAVGVFAIFYLRWRVRQ
jgi:hypothetical protein